jgi:hypothetical protein
VTTQGLLLLVVFAVGGCDFDVSDFVRFSSTTEIPSLDDDVAKILAENGLPGATASCPNKVFEDGKAVECAATMPDGFAFTTVVEHDGDGHITVFAKDGALPIQGLAANVLEMMRAEAKDNGVDLSDATIDCGHGFVLDRKGETLRCEVVHRGKTLPLAIELLGGGRFSWQPLGK